MLAAQAFIAASQRLISHNSSQVPKIIKSKIKPTQNIKTPQQPLSDRRPNNTNAVYPQVLASIQQVRRSLSQAGLDTKKVSASLQLG
jgi:hypothetical protein